MYLIVLIENYGRCHTAHGTSRELFMSQYRAFFNAVYYLLFLLNTACLQVTNIEKRIDTLSWKIKKFERVLFSENETSHSVSIILLTIILVTITYSAPIGTKIEDGW